MPHRWRKINTVTISYGHGIAVTPLQLASGVAALVNGGLFIHPTLLKRNNEATIVSKRVLSIKTSEKIRALMQMVVEKGTGRQAAVKGYSVGGKTGSADKLSVGGYRKNATISSFVGAFPINKPRYVLLIIVDEPKGNTRTFNYSTGGWVAAPAVGRIVQGMAPLLGLVPERLELEEKPYKSISLTKKYEAPIKKTEFKASPEARLKKRSGVGEEKLLKKIMVVLEPPESKRKGWNARSQEQAIATY
jgi:cell division protein FtsI (penicillin-binding protein 3)